MATQKSRYKPRDFDDMRFNHERGGRWRDSKIHHDNRERSLERPQILRWQDSESSAKPLQRRVRSTSPLRNFNNEREWLHETSPVFREKFHPRAVEQVNRRDGASQRLLGQKATVTIESRESSTQLIPANWTENSGQVPKLLKPQFGEPRHNPQAPYSPTDSPIYAAPIHREIINHHRHINHGTILDLKALLKSAKSLTGFETIQPYSYETAAREIDSNYYPSHSSCRLYDSPGDSTRVQISGTNINDTIIYESTRSNSCAEDFPNNPKESQSICIRVEHPRWYRNPQTQEFENGDEYAYQRNSERSHFDEAWNGASKDWTIIDVPSGTKRVRFESIGGEIQEITWQKYSGVRRSNHVSNRVRTESNVILTKQPEISDREHLETANDSTNQKTSSLELQLANDLKAKGNMEINERSTYYPEDSYDKPSCKFNPTNLASEDLWTEITKDLVVRQAIVEMGYEFEETRFFFYIFRYLPYEEIVHLIELSNQIRHCRHKRLQEIEWERESLQDYNKVKGIFV
ncbi:hypothetical protein OnM2_021083 [Erysiphe neolycopersici]|uniref:DUF8035 domain-containing protein n=1 Tax=Erysiphe neolycopersici TaxID=212602 RepID=A0A420I371_9PEZI|nr:hypothetical protein OnM2_021083 [Erysiphe neolycopersici]